MDAIFQRLLNVIKEQQAIIESITTKIQQLESIGGRSESIEDYVSGKTYKRNTLIVDPVMETVYRVIAPYTSVDIDTDHANGNIKLVGFESQVVTFNHKPTQAEIDVLPDDALVAIYSSTDVPYIPDLQG